MSEIGKTVEARQVQVRPLESDKIICSSMPTDNRCHVNRKIPVELVKLAKPPEDIEKVHICFVECPSCKASSRIKVSRETFMYLFAEGAEWVEPSPIADQERTTVKSSDDLDAFLRDIECIKTMPERSIVEKAILASAGVKVNF